MNLPIPENPALFLDVDGTLLPISTRPQDTRPGPELLALLARLSSALHGAVALVSGRTAATVTEMFAPLSLPTAGTHGLELRLADGRIRDAEVDQPGFSSVRADIEAMVMADPSLYLEDKGNALAIHYRLARDRADDILRNLEICIRALGPGYHIQHGLHVFEIKPAAANKGTALRMLMAEPEFAGRVPIAIGDDLTDVHAFREAELLGGLGIAVGDRISARWRFADPPALHRWLEDVIRIVDSQ